MVTLHWLRVINSGIVKMFKILYGQSAAKLLYKMININNNYKFLFKQGFEEEVESFLPKYIERKSSLTAPPELMNLYWIHEPEQDLYLEGYVGITVDTDRRFKEHSTKSWHSEDLIYDILFTGSWEEALAIEYYLRQDSNIGWNVSRGGGGYPTLTPEVLSLRSSRAAKTRKSNGHYTFEKASERGYRGSKTKRESGLYETKKWKTSIEKRAENRKRSNFYSSASFKEGILKSVQTKKSLGFYSKEKSQERGIKAAKTLRDSGFYEGKRNFLGR